MVKNNCFLVPKVPARYWKPPARGDVINAAGSCQYLAMKMAANNEGVSA
jgi:hypothetical protein